MALPVNINELINGRTVEWERIEFKKSWDPLNILHRICAFANDFNNWGGGYIIIGIKEKQGRPILPPCGLSLGRIDSIQKELLNICHRLRPHYFPVVEVVEFKNRTILIIWCPGGANRPYKAPVSFAKGASYVSYIRRYSSTKKASESEERELLSMANKVPFDDQVNHRAKITDLNLTLIQAFLTEVKSALAEESTQMPFSELCLKMNITEGPQEYLRPKNVGLLFFNGRPDKFFPGAHIDIVEFEDEVGDSFREKSFKGPLHQQLRDALNYLKNEIIAESVRKLPGRAEAKRFFNYPYEAIEEALVNAVYHRSYEDPSSVEVRIFPSRIEIVSYPGPLPPLNKDNLMKERVVARRYRNRRIGDFLKELHLTEGRGTGFPKIRKALKINGSPPPIFDTDDERSYFATILHIHPQARVKAQVEAQVKAQVEITAIERRVLSECLSGSISKKEIALKIGHKGISGSLKKAIAQLINKKLIEYTIPEKPKSRLQKYTITPTGRELLKK
jgi:ATP-dependent DNA helicase RecG